MDIFSKIAAGEIPSYKCAESEKFYAFLDINPVAKGHTLVIPRREVDYIFDMDDEEIAEYQVFAKKVAMALKKAFPCRKVAQVVLGLEVPHATLGAVFLFTGSTTMFSSHTCGSCSFTSDAYSVLVVMKIFSFGIILTKRS